VSMMTVFPATLVLLDRRRDDREGVGAPRTHAFEQLEVPLVERLAAWPRAVLAGALVVTAASLVALTSVEFDYNLLNLQAPGTESVAWERRILATAGRSGFTAMATADSLEELRRKQAAFSRLGSVSEVDSALLLFPEDQEEKRKIIGDFAPLVTAVRIARPRPVDVGRLAEAFQILKRRLDIAGHEAPPGEARTALGRVSAEIDGVLQKLERRDREATEAALGLLQHQLYRDFLRSFQRLQANLAPRPVDGRELPEELRRKFVSDRGEYLMKIHPAVDIWEREGAARFVQELRAVDPDVTGTPIITFEALRLMERAWQQGTVYAILLIGGIALLMFRRLRETLLACLPLGLGLLWLVGLMVVFGERFTMGNVFALPLILGAGAEYGLNVVLRFMEGREHGGPLLARSTVMAVLVNGLTTIAGFSSLMLADHRGIYGLGLLLTVGSLTCLVASLVVLPVLLRLVRRATP
jgi:uncharacterized protein